MLLIANLANVFQYFYQFIAARGLSVEDYGVMNSIVYVATLIVTSVSVIPFAKIIIKNKHNLNSIISRIIFIVSIITGILSTLIFLANGLLTDYLNITDRTPIFILVILFASFAIMNLFIGIIYGLLWYVDATLKKFLAAFLKFLIGYIVIFVLGYSYNGALLSIIMANIIVIIWGYITLNNYIKTEYFKINRELLSLLKQTAVYSFPVALSAFAFNIATNIDIVITKNLLEAKTAGIYSAVSLTGKIAVFIPAILAQILYPQVSREMQDNRSSLNSILTIMGLTFLISLTYVAVVSFFPELVIRILFGTKYTAGADVLVVIGMAMAVLAGINVVFNFLLAKEKYTYLYISYAAIAVMLFIIYVFLNDTMMQIASGILIGAILIAAGNFALIAFYYLKMHKS